MVLVQSGNWICKEVSLKGTHNSKVIIYLIRVFNYGYSTWTIDLCYILAYYGVKHEMFTMSMGVNPDLRSEQFYKAAIDKVRINTCKDIPNTIYEYNGNDNFYFNILG